MSEEDPGPAASEDALLPFRERAGRVWSEASDQTNSTAPGSSVGGPYRKPARSPAAVGELGQTYLGIWREAIEALPGLAEAHLRLYEGLLHLGSRTEAYEVCRAAARVGRWQLLDRGIRDLPTCATKAELEAAAGRALRARSTPSVEAVVRAHLSRVRPIAAANILLRHHELDGCEAVSVALLVDTLLLLIRERKFEATSRFHGRLASWLEGQLDVDWLAAHELVGLGSELSSDVVVALAGGLLLKDPIERSSFVTRQLAQVWRSDHEKAFRLIRSEAPTVAALLSHSLVPLPEVDTQK